MRVWHLSVREGHEAKGFERALVIAETPKEALEVVGGDIGKASISVKDVGDYLGRGKRGDIVYLQRSA
jgi:hypothetical protein